MKILIIGAGVMANLVRTSALKKGLFVVGMYDKKIPTDFNDLNNINEQVDAVIDFSHPENTDDVLNFAKQKSIPILFGVTGQSNSQLSSIMEASKEIPILLASNTSYGVYVLNQIVKLASELMKDFDIEIIEKHHNRKIDAPSGTLQLLANTVSENRNLNVVTDRTSKHESRDANDLGIHSIRAGNIFGEHTVIFSKDDEVIEITHEALSRNIFADGSIKLVKLLVGREPKLYKVSDLIEY